MAGGGELFKQSVEIIHLIQTVRRFNQLVYCFPSSKWNRTRGSPAADRQMGLTRSTGDDRPDEEEPIEYCVLGDAIGAAVADRLRAEGRVVELVAHEATTDTPRDGSPDLEDWIPDGPAFDRPSTFVVATGSDRRNLLLAQQVRTRFDADRILVLVHDPTRLEPFAAAGHEPVCATTALSEAVLGAL